MASSLERVTTRCRDWVSSSAGKAKVSVSRIPKPMSVGPVAKTQCALTKTVSTALFFTISRAMKFQMARSLCGAITNSWSAHSDVRLEYVVRLTTLTPLLRKRWSTTRAHSMGCISAMLAPHVTMVSVSSMSS